jgi:hypothetical protein
MEPQTPAEPRTAVDPDDARRLYHAPELRELGTLADVTQLNPSTVSQDATYNPGGS